MVLCGVAEAQTLKLEAECVPPKGQMATFGWAEVGETVLQSPSDGVILEDDGFSGTVIRIFSRDDTEDVWHIEFADQTATMVKVYDDAFRMTFIEAGASQTWIYSLYPKLEYLGMSSHRTRYNFLNPERGQAAISSFSSTCSIF